MVPDGTEKNKLTELYDGFKNRAMQGTVAPEQIENVDANILNVSNSETTLTPQQAEGVIRAAMLVPRPEIFAKPQIGKEPKELLPPKKFAKSRREDDLGERLIKMFEFMSVCIR